MIADRTGLVSNLIEFCKGSPKRVAILLAVRKPKNYTEVAKIVNADPTYCSNVLNRMKGLGLVTESEEKRGVYRQTDLLKTVNIESEMKHSGRTSIPIQQKESEMVKEVVRIFDIEKAADFLDLDPTIRNDCFPPRRKPNRKDVGEAYLTLETVLRDEMYLPRSTVGVKLVSAAAEKGLFNREVQSERDGLIQLYNGAFQWFRNTTHHTKADISKEEAIKMILFADYLIKLIRRLKAENGLNGDTRR